jgi:hypothetical protein
LILYINEKDLKVDLIEPNWIEIRALMMTRNQLAVDIRSAFRVDSSTSTLPPMLKNLNDCQYCYQAAECLLLHATVENGTAETSGVKPLFDFALAGLTASQVQYVRQWSRLVDLEAAATRMQSPIWTALSDANEENDGTEYGGKSTYDDQSNYSVGKLDFKSCKKVVNDNVASFELLLAIPSVDSPLTNAPHHSSLVQDKENNQNIRNATLDKNEYPDKLLFSKPHAVKSFVAHRAAIALSSRFQVGNRVVLSVETDQDLMHSNLRKRKHEEKTALFVATKRT